MLFPFIVLLQAFLHPIQQGFLFEVFGFKAFQSGAFFGIVIGLRLLVIGFTVPLLLMTTKTSELIGSSRRFLPGFLVLALTITFRFIPIFEEQFHKIKMAQEARAVNTRKPKSLITLIVPLFLKALKRSQTMALSIESRGFGAE
jgi:energy-coupling factor transport system permease protein